jgi:hypothetical protein
MDLRQVVPAVLSLIAAAGLISCGSANPNIGRVLTSIDVTPQATDANTSPNGQVVFTATGTFSLPPTPAPVTFVAPYAGQFVVDNPLNSTVATVVSSSTGTVTVQCATGASGTVSIVATASANNGSTTVVSGSAELTCP